MKKTPIMIALAALATLASCTQDEPVDINKGHAIGFRSGMGAASRATEINNSNLQSFIVTALLGGTDFFDGQTFNKEANTAYYVSSPEYFWPTDDSELQFYAYAPENPGGTVKLDATSQTITDFSPADKMGDQIDLVTANATGKQSTNEATGVQLTFDHRLSQIEVMAKSDNDAYTFAISGVRIGEPVAQGTFDFPTSDWTLGSTKTIYEDTYDTPVVLSSTVQSVMGDGGNAMLLPQQLTAWDPTGDGSNSKQGAYLSVKLTAATIAGAKVYPFPSEPDCMWAAIPIDTNWEPGKKYVYVLDFTHGAGNVDPNDPDPGKPVLGGPIKFTVTVTDWDVQPDIDIPMESGTSTNS
ncbi:MAG: fimbrillin family protein [Paramuribaculum sp.]|nr:fimbrillin family protein [Paramuribaculum sp.]